METSHCVKSVQIPSHFGPYFPVFSPNRGKDGPEITPNLDTFYAVKLILDATFCNNLKCKMYHSDSVGKFMP